MRTKATERQKEKRKGKQKRNEKRRRRKTTPKRRKWATGRKRSKERTRKEGQDKEGREPSTEEKGKKNPQDKKGSQQQKTNKSKNIFKIILTQPQEEKGEVLTQMLTKPKQDIKRLQVPAAKRNKKTKDREKIRKEKTSRNQRGKRPTDTNIGKPKQ